MANLTDRQIKELVGNSVALARAAVAARAGKDYGGQRDTWKILGYDRHLTFKDYLAMYERQDIAGRIVDMPADDTWRSPPRIVSSSDPNTALGDDFVQFANRVNLWPKVKSADILSGIGRYSVLVIGVSDGRDWADPVPVDVDDGISLDDIAYVSQYHEEHAEIVNVVTDKNDPNFGMPSAYKIRLLDLESVKFAGRVLKADGSPTRTDSVEKVVHASRVIHIAENAIYDRIFGRPRLKRVHNRLKDMVKAVGGSAEMFWQNVAQIIHVNLDPELEYSDSDLNDLNEKFQEMLLGLRRIIQTEGIEEIKTLQGETPDPRGVFIVLRTLISAAAEIPQRMLFGSESGEMASTQDQREWYGRVESRRQNFAGPNIIRPLVDRLASWGAVTLPEGGYRVDWTPLYQPSAEERAQHGRALAMSASKLQSDNPLHVVGISEFREVVGLKPEMSAEDKAYAEAIDDEKERKAQEMADRMADAEGGGDDDEDNPPLPPEE